MLAFERGKRQPVAECVSGHKSYCSTDALSSPLFFWGMDSLDVSNCLELDSAVV